jgi:hypothetical protein
MKGYLTIIKGGEFWVAEILYTNGADAKKRPVLVLWVDGQDAVVAVVTSAPPRTVTDVLLNQWLECGLKVSSTVRLSRLDCSAPTHPHRPRQTIQKRLHLDEISHQPKQPPASL